MEFPEIEYGSRVAVEAALDKIRQAMDLDGDRARKIVEIALGIKETYTDLEPYFRRFIEPFCAKCATPCCVNRHGYPDFEDLIFFNATGRQMNDFDFSCNDTDACQYLGDSGCILSRCVRSYRCTWYFCDEVLDAFKSRDDKAFKKFEYLTKRLASQRMTLIREFEFL